MNFRIFKKSTNELLSTGEIKNLYDIASVDGLINKALYACVNFNIVPNDIEIEVDDYTQETYVMCLTGDYGDISLRHYETRWYDNDGDIIKRYKCDHNYFGSL